MSEKNIPASALKLKKAKERGQIAKSEILFSGLIFALLLVFCPFILEFAWLRFDFLIEYCLKDTSLACLPCFLEASKSFILVFLLIFGGLFVFSISLRKVMFCLQALPVASLFKWKGSFIGYFSNIKSNLAIISLSFAFLLALHFILLHSLLMGQGQRLAFLSETKTLYLLIILVVFEIFIGVLDFYLRKKSWLKSLMMTREELRQEFKESEGDPMVKQFRQSEEQRIIYEQIIQKVKTAKFIVANK